MLNVLLVAILALAALLLILFGALCLAIRNEDHRPRLDPQPPTFGAALTRRITGLSVRYDIPDPPVRPSAALHSSPPDGDRERR